MATARTPRTGRKRQNVTLVDRDFKILYTVGRFGLASTRHLTDLYFKGVANTAHKRLRALHNAGYLQAHVVLGSVSPTLYTLSSQGREVLVQRFAIGRELQPNPRTLDVADLKHRIAICDVRVALILATEQKSKLQLLHFHIGSEVIAHTKAVGLETIPDALILLKRNGQQFLYLLEVDLNTEPLSEWKSKVTRLSDALLYPPSILGQNNWYVLVAAPGKSRLQAIAKVCSKYPNSDHFLFTNLSELTPKTFLESTWQSTSVFISNTHPFLTENNNDIHD